MLGSKPGFLSIGVTAADLRGDGTEPEVREEWMMAVIRGSREGREVITREDGRGSSWQVDGLKVWMSFDKTMAEGSWKQERGTERGGGNKSRRTTGRMRGQLLMDGSYFSVEK